jgi:hypothetical protein
MGALDWLKARLGSSQTPGSEVADRPGTALGPHEVDVRRAQVSELDDALRSLARAMAADTTLMANPGWRGRVEDLRFAANEAARLQREGFDRAALQDLAAEVRPLYRGADVPAEYAPYRDEHERVLAAVSALRSASSQA